MRKILLSLIMIVLIVIMALTIKDGVTVGSFKLPGFLEIKEKNDELTELIAEANEKKEKYQGSLDLLESDATAMAKAKKEYLDLVQVSTDNDIKEALQTKTYTIEYLWSKIGNYAAKEGLDMKIELTGSTVGTQDYRNLLFTLKGKYLQVVNFIFDIENDSALDFTIDNFSMTKDSAKFTVKDIKLEAGTTVTGTTFSPDSSAQTSTTPQGIGTNGSANAPQGTTPAPGITPQGTASPSTPNSTPAATPTVTPVNQ